jgi:hypothetical protein
VTSQIAADPEIWNAAALMRLAAILARRPLPSNAKIVWEMGVTKAAFQTAMSRFGISRYIRSENVQPQPRGTGHRRSGSACAAGSGSATASTVVWASLAKRKES